MNLRRFRTVAIGAILFGAAACVDINEELGKNFIPTDNQWDVFTPAPVNIEQIELQMSDSLSGYSTSRFTFGSINDDTFGTCVKSTCFTLVPIASDLDFGTSPEVIQFHFCAIRDTLSTSVDNQIGITQNVYISELKQPLDSSVMYSGAFMDAATRDKYLDESNYITSGIPVYDGGDSLSFNFSKEFSQDLIRRLDKISLDTLDNYLSIFPGIYITTDTPVGNGGRINMFELALGTNSYGYITGNYAELKIRSTYEYSEEPVDTSFIFYFGPAELLDEEDTGYPSQFAFNASSHTGSKVNSGTVAQEKLYVEGGSGIKPVVKAKELKEKLESLLNEYGITDPSQVVINKATIILPYETEGLPDGFSALNKFPMILSPTVRLYSSDSTYVSYAGLTDSSVESENQGDINRSKSVYSPDISHHLQEILKIDSKAADFEEKIRKYDIWMLIMHEEITTTSTNNSYDDYYNNLLYNSYYNNMMYDPYGYGYGYGGYGGYGYGGYGGYGYSNYYNYYMMAALASSSSSNTTTSSSIELDKDRYYKGILNGPTAAGRKPQLKVTFSAPKTAK